MVKRGDPISAARSSKSGQTGNVDAPQLQFRGPQGAVAADPMPL